MLFVQNWFKNVYFKIVHPQTTRNPHVWHNEMIDERTRAEHNQHPTFGRNIRGKPSAKFLKKKRLQQPSIVRRHV